MKEFDIREYIFKRKISDNEAYLIRKMIGLDEFDKIDESCVIVIPSKDLFQNIDVISPILLPSYKYLGKEKFERKFKIRRYDSDILRSIRFKESKYIDVSYNLYESDEDGLFEDTSIINDLKEEKINQQDSKILEILLINQIRIMFALCELVGKDSGQYESIINSIERSIKTVENISLKNFHKK